MFKLRIEAGNEKRDVYIDNEVDLGTILNILRNSVVIKERRERNGVDYDEDIFLEVTV